jgi:hypothetical protein
MNQTGMWATNDDGLTDILTAQKQLAAAFTRVTSPAISQRLMDVLGVHLRITASEQLVDDRWLRYANGCLTVSEQLKHQLKETP